MIDNLKVSPAPDPHFFLTTRSDDVYDPEASIHLSLAPTDTDSFQRILPEVDDLRSIKTFLVYCVEYDVFFGAGRIKLEES